MTGFLSKGAGGEFGLDTFFLRVGGDMGGRGQWAFALDDDGMVIPQAPTGTPENLRLAIETLIVPFGLRHGVAEEFLQQYRKMEREFQIGYSVSTSSASVKRLSLNSVEIEDFYGQFKNCIMNAVEFVAIIERLAVFINSLE